MEAQQLRLVEVTNMARCRCVIALIGVLALGLTVEKVEAFSLKLDGTNWEASWEDPTLTLAWDKSISTLTKKVTFTTFDPIPITFENKVAPHTDLGIITIKNTATN